LKIRAASDTYAGCREKEKPPVPSCVEGGGTHPWRRSSSFREAPMQELQRQASILAASRQHVEFHQPIPQDELAPSHELADEMETLDELDFGPAVDGRTKNSQQLAEEAVAQMEAQELAAKEATERLALQMNLMYGTWMPARPLE